MNNAKGVRDGSFLLRLELTEILKNLQKKRIPLTLPIELIVQKADQDEKKSQFGKIVSSTHVKWTPPIESNH